MTGTIKLGTAASLIPCSVCGKQWCDCKRKTKFEEEFPLLLNRHFYYKGQSRRKYWYMEDIRLCCLDRKKVKDFLDWVEINCILNTDLNEYARKKKELLK